MRFLLTDTLWLLCVLQVRLLRVPHLRRLLDHLLHRVVPPQETHPLIPCVCVVGEREREREREREEEETERNVNKPVITVNMKLKCKEIHHQRTSQ